MSTVAPGWKPEPAIVTTVPPAAAPESGVMETAVGASQAGFKNFVAATSMLPCCSQPETSVTMRA